MTAYGDGVKEERVSAGILEGGDSLMPAYETRVAGYDPVFGTVGGAPQPGRVLCALEPYRRG